MDAPPSDPATESRPINRVNLACVQCRSRHVKCDASQPVCNRCRRDGKECTYQKSRRGGLDKAALAARRLRLQKQAEEAQPQKKNQSNENSPGRLSSTASSHGAEQDETISISNLHALSTIGGSAQAMSNTIAFQINTDRLVDLFYENFWPALPVTLPLHYLTQRKLNDNHGLDHLFLVMQFVGSVYAPWTPSEPYYQAAYQALLTPELPKTCFVVQALMIFAVAQHHCDMRPEARKMLDRAIEIGLELGVNTKEFAYRHGEGNPALEESWRRTYYFLHISDQHFAVVVNNPLFTMLNVHNSVDLPCEDEFYETGLIPPAATLQEYEMREFADVEVVYSSITYLYDVSRVVSYIMKTFLETGTFSDSIIQVSDAKIAVWQSLLPVSKRDPLRQDGKVDEVMFLAHFVAAIVTMNVHRPFSSLVYSLEELSTQSFVSPVPFIEPLKQGRAAHTARSLKAIEMQTKLLAIPCRLETHNLFTLCITASIATAQISACNTLLEDHALSIARDRLRLTIGFLNQMGSLWPLAKKMAKEVRYIARQTLAGGTINTTTEPDHTQEIEIPRDDLIWPVDPCASIDIYSGIVLPLNWENGMYQSSSTSSTLS